MRCRTTCLLILLKTLSNRFVVNLNFYCFPWPYMSSSSYVSILDFWFHHFPNLFIADDKIFYIKYIRNSFYFSINYFFGNTGEEFSFGWKWNSLTALWPFPGWLFFSFSFICKIAYAQKGSFYKALLLM